ncbi:MAG: hypothetical protein QOF24_924 [Verrucomicrobiota bacterium]|jgi:hypothetical protein
MTKTVSSRAAETARDLTNALLSHKLEATTFAMLIFAERASGFA